MYANIRTASALIAISYISLLSGCNKEQCSIEQRNALNNQSVQNYANPDRWKAVIQKFVDNDKKNPPPKNAVLFVGSSSIRMWDTSKWFPDIPNINRGFGGSYVIDSYIYADQIITPYKPRTIVFYAGDNDAADKKPPQMVLADFEALFFKVRKELPKTKIVVISTKPSIARWKFWPQMLEANNYIEIFCKKQQNTAFVDVSKVMLDSAGQPRKDIFLSDGLHLNEKGYELWTSLVKPLIINE
ncbi:MAG: GDSL-type esterase/lipase family protein [Phycisphaerales bacterium]